MLIRWLWSCYGGRHFIDRFIASKVGRCFVVLQSLFEARHFVTSAPYFRVSSSLAPLDVCPKEPA